MRTNILGLLATPLLALSACLPGATLEDGEVAGNELTPQSVFHFEENDVVVVVVAEHPDLCQRSIDNDAAVEDLKALTFIIADLDVDGSTDDIEPGRFEIGEDTGKSAFAFYGESDGNCQSEVGLTATSGEVIVESYERRGAMSATFSLEMDGDDVIGSFRTAECDIDQQDFVRDNEECEP